MTRPECIDEAIRLTKQALGRAVSEDDAVKKRMQTLLQEVLEAERRLVAETISILTHAKAELFPPRQ